MLDEHRQHVVAQALEVAAQVGSAQVAHRQARAHHVAVGAVIGGVVHTRGHVAVVPHLAVGRIHTNDGTASIGVGHKLASIVAVVERGAAGVGHTHEAAHLRGPGHLAGVVAGGEHGSRRTGQAADAETRLGHRRALLGRSGGNVAHIEAMGDCTRGHTVGLDAASAAHGGCDVALVPAMGNRVVASRHEAHDTAQGIKTAYVAGIVTMGDHSVTVGGGGDAGSSALASHNAARVVAVVDGHGIAGR